MPLADPFPVLDQDTLEQLKKLLGSNFGVLLTTYKTDAHQKIEAAFKLTAKENYSELAKNIHSLKGASLNLGAKATVHCCKQIEQQIRDQQFSQLNASLDQLSIEISRLIQLLDDQA